jgi:hypothetical protein
MNDSVSAVFVMSHAMPIGRTTNKGMHLGFTLHEKSFLGAFSCVFKFKLETPARGGPEDGPLLLQCKSSGSRKSRCWTYQDVGRTRGPRQ